MGAATLGQRLCVLNAASLAAVLRMMMTMMNQLLPHLLYHPSPKAMKMADDLKLFASDKGLDAVYQHAVQIEAELTVEGIFANHQE